MTRMLLVGEKFKKFERIEVRYDRSGICEILWCRTVVQIVEKGVSGEQNATWSDPRTFRAWDVSNRSTERDLRSESIVTIVCARRARFTNP